MRPSVAIVKNLSKKEQGYMMKTFANDIRINKINIEADNCLYELILIYK